MYRIRRGWECGPGCTTSPDANGSCLSVAAGDSGRNFLTPGIWSAVQQRMLHGEPGNLIEPGRLKRNMLSSQPMCFNLFLPQALSTRLATRIWRRILPHEVMEVVEVKVEHSPGRGNPQWSGDSSSFDAFVKYQRTNGEFGFLAIETKYTDTFSNTNSLHPYSRALAWLPLLFSPEGLRNLANGSPTELLRTHLLAASLLNTALTEPIYGVRFTHGYYLVLHAQSDLECATVLRRYEAGLAEAGRQTYASLSLEAFCAIVGSVAAGRESAWIRKFRERYTDWAWVRGEIREII